MKQHISISLRLTIWFGVMFFLGWILFGTAMWVNLNRVLTNERYQTLARRLDRLQELLQKNEGGDRSADLRDFAHATGNGLVEIFRMDGTRAFASPSINANSFPWPDMRDAAADERFVQADFFGQPYWVMMRPFKLHEMHLVLLAAAPITGNLLVLNSFWKGLLSSVPVLLLISSAAGYWISRKALQPVDEITATARSISIRNLSDRLPVLHTGDELQRLTETCNAMFERLEASVNRIRQFTGDASHELRGPLSFVRTVAEVALRNHRADVESRQAFNEIVDETAKAGVLLQDMLTLARADSELFSSAFEPVDLTEVVEETYGIAQPLAEKRNLTLSVESVADQMVSVSGDFTSLRRLLWILLDNALKYTKASGHIEVVLRTSGNYALLEVRDDGIGIARHDLPYIFDRFYRADPSRSEVEGSGLGLAIAKYIAEMHSAKLTIDSKLNHGTTCRLIVPLITGYSSTDEIARSNQQISELFTF